MGNTDTILIREEEILSRIALLGEKISQDYQGQELVLLGLLTGSFIFLADLARKISLPLRIEFLRASSYAGTQSTGKILFDQTFTPLAKGRHILIVDDILDTGLTLNTIKEHIMAQCQALSVKTCVLLKKPASDALTFKADYIGFEIENEFVVGYGLDYNEQHRNLPSIAVLKIETSSKP